MPSDKNVYDEEMYSDEDESYLISKLLTLDDCLANPKLKKILEDDHFRRVEEVLIPNIECEAKTIFDEIASMLNENSESDFDSLPINDYKECSWRFNTTAESLSGLVSGLVCKHINKTYNTQYFIDNPFLVRDIIDNKINA